MARAQKKLPTPGNETKATKFGYISEHDLFLKGIRDAVNKSQSELNQLRSDRAEMMAQLTVIDQRIPDLEAVVFDGKMVLGQGPGGDRSLRPTPNIIEGQRNEQT